MEDDEEFGHDAETDAGVSGTRGVRYLSVKASIKEDLQAIFELQKEVGQAIWSLHKLIAAVNIGSGAHQTAFVQANSDLAELLERLAERQDSLQAKLEEVTELTESHLATIHGEIEKVSEEFNKHRVTLSNNWERINAAIDTILTANGVDPRTLVQPNREILDELRGQKTRRERWVNAIIGAAVGVISTAILGFYARSVSTAQAETHESTKEILKEIQTIADSVKKSQSELDQHIANEDKEVRARVKRGGRQ